METCTEMLHEQVDRDAVWISNDTTSVHRCLSSVAKRSYVEQLNMLMRTRTENLENI